MTAYRINQLDGADPHGFLVALGFLIAAGPTATLHWEDRHPVLTIPDTTWLTTHPSVGDYLYEQVNTLTNPHPESNPAAAANLLARNTGTSTPEITTWAGVVTEAWTHEPSPASWTRLVQCANRKSGTTQLSGSVFWLGAGPTSARTGMSSAHVKAPNPHSENAYERNPQVFGAEQINTALTGGNPFYERTNSMGYISPTGFDTLVSIGEEGKADLVRIWEWFGTLASTLMPPAGFNAPRKGLRWFLWATPMTLPAVHATQRARNPTLPDTQTYFAQILTINKQGRYQIKDTL